MTRQLLRVLPYGTVGALVAILTAGVLPAQEPIPLFPPGGAPRVPAGDPEPVPLPLPAARPAQPEQPGEGPEVLAKGPVHEAFATTAEAPVASPIVPKQPPEPIEELPPDQKPEGDNVQWIPGYWHWDDEGAKFIWISGFWRQPPPGRMWVPGSWREAKGGWQWVSGFWQEVNPNPQPDRGPAQPEIEYLPQPPETVELGPTVPAPNATSFYVPGSWVWRNRYVWRPGVWVGHRANWLWVPARYHWTPAGYVFVDGYWDHPVATRGVLFAPVAFVRPLRPAFVYTPLYVVSEPALVGALFVRRGYSGYFFGDYFDNRYATGGFSAWCGTYSRNGFTVGFGVGRTWGYDPLWSYYATTYRDRPAWQRGVGDLYNGRYRNDLVRPPTTLVQQNTTINNITRTNVANVTNNITVVNGTPTVNNRDVSNVAMVAPLRVAPDLTRTRFEPVSADARRTEAGAAQQLREVAAQRQRLETHVAKQQPARPPVGQPAAQPATIKLDVPKVAVARAQVRDEARQPPPSPHRGGSTITGNPTPKTDPPRVDPRPPVVQPKIEPRPPVVQPPVQPKVDPRPPVVQPKNDPPPVVDPKPPVVVPKNDPPRVDPRPPVVPPKVEVPRVEPKPPVVVPKNDPPRVEPRPPVQPKIEVPKIDPKPPVQPKVDPRPPVVQPKNDPPHVDPKPPVVVPKNDPPRVDPRPPVVPPKVEVPRVEPKPPVVVPKNDPPRVEPRPPVVQPKIEPRPPVVQPKVEVPRVEPNPPVTPPRVEPRPPVVQPKIEPRPTPPRVEPKPPAAPPRVEPRPAPKVEPRPAPPRPKGKG
ncbi:MAG: hypothetical protein FJ304_16460 [Planctomycetes bacterium]|nr:hypothetical protein [Planctomycetota bacterium]